MINGQCLVAQMVGVGADIKRVSYTLNLLCCAVDLISSYYRLELTTSFT